jgi:glycosyltransferase involved in cell wall biosynthesis
MIRDNSDFSSIGFPFKLVEMLASGKPVLCSRVKSIQNYLNDDEIFYYEPNDENCLKETLVNIISNYRNALIVGNKGRCKCESLFSANRLNFNIILNHFQNNWKNEELSAV